MKFIALLLFVYASATTAATSVTDLTLDGSPYKYEPVSFEECSEGERCDETAAMDEFVLIRAEGGATCPAGYYFLLNNKTMEAEDVNTGTCDPGFELTMAKSKKTNQRMLVALRHNEIIWNYNLDGQK